MTELLAELEPWLSARVPVLSVETAAREYTRRKPNAEAEDPIARHTRDHPDLLVVLGGDGAILGAVRAFAAAPVPT
ncbi:MAG TPA: NAD(+)/NADH kinase, partial [Myxococcota bacterium]|nr:NAD(+)/NADH kinase [Myxococcota bacterium]